MSSPNFPSTGLVPNETKFTVGALTYLWDGEKWRTITAKLSADQITYEGVKNVKEQIDENTDVIRSLLIAQGLSGNYGFFEKGFTYSIIGDIGIDVNGNSWIYVGAGAPNKVVSAGTVPSTGAGYEQVTFNAAISENSITNAKLHATREGQVINVESYHEGYNAGGGTFTVGKAVHDGGLHISLSRSFPTDWNDNAQLEQWFSVGVADELCLIRQVDEVDPLNFGAFNVIDYTTGVAPAYSDYSFRAAQNYAKDNKRVVTHSSGFYRLANDYIIKVGTKGNGKEACNVIFDNGFGFRTYSNVQTRFFVPEISGIHFLSDKEQMWNPIDAGDSFVVGIESYMVRLKYGQRVSKGNFITTPNNILSNNPSEQQEGSGFWNKNYGQWMQEPNVEVDLSGVPLAYTNDSNIIYTYGYAKTVRDCRFSGFTHSLVLAGVIEESVSGCDFLSCNVGIYTRDASFIGGASGERITTINIKENVFTDVDIGIYGHTLSQSLVDDSNVFQPCICGVYIDSGGAPNTEIKNNYFEVGHTFFYHKPNLPMYGEVGRNFTNSSYTRYLAWCSSGQKLNFTKPNSNTQVIHFQAGVQSSDLDAGFLADVVSPYFLDNGNSIGGNSVKESIFKTTGDSGTSFSIANIYSSIKDYGGAGIFPSVSPSQEGINLSGIRVVNIEVMNKYCVYGYFNGGGSNPQDNSVRFFWDVSSGSPVSLRVDGEINTIKVLWY